MHYIFFHEEIPHSSYLRGYDIFIDLLNFIDINANADLFILLVIVDVHLKLVNVPIAKIILVVQVITFFQIIVKLMKTR